MLDTKHILAVVAGAIGGNLASWAQTVATGQHVPFTFGTIIGSAIPGIVLAFVMLYTNAPTVPPAK
jgi:hypothetical protein